MKNQKDRPVIIINHETNGGHSKIPTWALQIAAISWAICIGIMVYYYRFGF